MMYFFISNSPNLIMKKIYHAIYGITKIDVTLKPDAGVGVIQVILLKVQLYLV
jgi:hypothetical protein